MERGSPPADGPTEDSERELLETFVLVVEDDPTVRTLLIRLLTNNGHRVRAASNGDSALTLVSAAVPRAVISDVVMPGISGIELRRKLLDLLPGVPVILISGFSHEGPAEFAARTPDTYFVPKPFDVSDLLGLLAEVSGV